MAAPEGNSSSAQAANFKAFLMKKSARSNQSVYEHLTRLLTKLMDERPDDALDVFEEMSRSVKQDAFKGVQSTLKTVAGPSAAELLAEKQRLLFIPTDDSVLEKEVVGAVFPNLIEVAFYLEQAGVGLGQEETQKIYLALKHLVESKALTHCRLWGKILGRESNYIIVEAEAVYGDEDEEEEEQSAEEAPEEAKEAEAKEKNPVPQSTYKPPPLVPKESLGTGANKYIYYVCSEPGLPWVKLPSVNPAQICAARQIRKFFTGRLDHPIQTYPPFPGNEANYLRAQIARISAGTHVSPQGFYQLAEEDDEFSQFHCEVNPDFEGIAVVEMATSLSAWVHHVPHILQQGRCTWVNMAVKPKEDSNEDEEADEEDEEEQDELEPEVGPPLLTPLSEDAELFNTPPWTCRLSTKLTPQHAIAVLRSNLWPGAYAYACGKKFENIYIGWGLKKALMEYSPPLPPQPQKEYPSGPEITEASDPTPEDELKLRQSLEEQHAAQEETEESEQEEEDEDEEEEDEDD